MIQYSLYDANKPGVILKAELPVSKQENKYIFDYPCEDSASCTDYSIQLPPGIYKFELYGASGGSYTNEVSTYHNESGECIPDSVVKQFNGNTKCLPSFDYGGAGGYVRGLITIKKSTQIYATIGGSGQYKMLNIAGQAENNFLKENMVPGGYGGGGSSSGDKTGTASGGGQTAVKFWNNTLYHLVIVSGGGGGSDDINANDGRGGSGGNLVAQGWWTESRYNGQYVANSSFGFTFGTGEAARFGASKNPNGVQNIYGLYDKCGTGGGWFGGFASLHYNGGCGGGSSWALTKNAYIPSGPIKSHNEYYELNESREYYFDRNSEYLFSEVKHVPGIRNGNGQLIITVVQYIHWNSCVTKYYLLNYFMSFALFIN